MKKMLFFIHFIAAIMLFSSTLHASGGHDKKHHKHHHKHHHSHPEEVIYYQPQPQPQYPRHVDRRSTEGLAGGVVGSVIGYEVGNGHPLATGIGAAAGSYLGNEIAGQK